MFGKSIKLFTLMGFEVKIDLSWVVLAALITWSLAAGVFPHYIKGLGEATYWWMGAVGTVGLFVSIVLHELSHSVVARRFGLAMRGITLFIFGGVAEMEEEPPSAKAELLMAVAGPAASIVIGGVCLAVARLGDSMAWPIEAIGVVGYLGYINLLLAAFNLIPAFPLDGGRVFRSILWWIKGNLRWATRIASVVGSAFAFLLIFLGIVNFIQGALISGIWWFVLGLFLNNASQVSYRQVVTRRALEGEPVRRFMRADPVTVPPSISVERLVEDYIYTHHYKMLPVIDGDRLLGCVTTRQVKDVPREEWGRRAVQELVQPCSQDNTVSPDTDATKALGMMSRTGSSRLMVVENGRLVGVIGLKDLLRFISLKVDLGDDRPHHRAA